MSPKKQMPSLSVELEPPALYKQKFSLETLVNQFLEKVLELANFTNWISITNRHTYHMTSLTAVKKALSILRKNNFSEIDVAMHLATRQDERTTYKQFIDAQAVGLRHLVPLLGDPRGPKGVHGYFENSLDLLRYAAYIATGDHKKIEQMGNRFEDLMVGDPQLPDRTNIKINFFQIGTILDPNPIRILGGHEFPIRDREIKLFPKKVTAGATYFMTQAIFQADDFFSFLDELNNPKIPIGVGLIPARLGLSERIGIPMPKHLRQRLRELHHDRAAQLKEGNQISHEIYQDLKYRGGKRVEWLHIYSIGSIKNVYEIIGDELNELHELQKNRKKTNSIFQRSL